MHFNFNTLLDQAGIAAANVRLLRHQKAYGNGCTPYSLWRDNPEEFERYQSAQRSDRRARFTADHWASFVVPPDGSTLFVGMYEIDGYDPAPVDWVDPLSRQNAGENEYKLDIYRFRRLPSFDPLIGCLKVDWGDGMRQWVQKANGATGNKAIVELLQTYREPDFPGFSRFTNNLAALPNLHRSWIAILTAAKGVYLLTCPRTKEQYVGSASGADGFWGRLLSYVATGHGGNVGLKSRDPSDYQVSILEVAGSLATMDDINALEKIWKAKLQSREMGLNRN